MIDKFALALPHLLMAIAAWRLLFRNDLDQDPPAEPAADPVQAGASPHA